MWAGRPLFFVDINFEKVIFSETPIFFKKSILNTETFEKVFFEKVIFSEKFWTAAPPRLFY